MPFKAWTVCLYVQHCVISPLPYLSWALSPTHPQWVEIVYLYFYFYTLSVSQSSILIMLWILKTWMEFCEDPEKLRIFEFPAHLASMTWCWEKSSNHYKKFRLIKLASQSLEWFCLGRKSNFVFFINFLHNNPVDF